MRKLLAGVRGDIAVKVFGEDYDAMLRAANHIAAVLRETKGAEDVKVEQVTGLPLLDIQIDKAAIARKETIVTSLRCLNLFVNNIRN